jgi:hypothetical protein
MSLTLSDFDAVLKNQYLGPIREQINTGTPLLDRIEKNYDSVVGKSFTIPLHYGRNEGMGARADGGALPAAGKQAYKEAVVPMRYLYGRINITGPTMKAARSNEGAFIRAVESEMKGITNDMKSSLNRQAFGDGTGALAVCASNSTVTITVDSTAKLRVGMPIDILVTATGATTNGVVATSVASITSSTVFVAADAPAGSLGDTYSVYLAGSRNLEMQGLSGIVSATSTLQGLDVATYPWWKATVQGNSSTNRAISDTILQTAIDTVSQISAGKPTALYTSYGVRRAYQALLTATKQLVNTQELKGGYKAITFNDLPIIADKDAPANKIFVVDESQLSFYRLADLDWMQEDGAILSRVSGYDAYEAVLFLYQELGTGMRNAHVRIDDITEA